jgi:hypothetical protein
MNQIVYVAAKVMLLTFTGNPKAVSPGLPGKRLLINHWYFLCL